jgi:RNA polymerase sigma-70 factor (ECF subfamily)
LETKVLDSESAQDNPDQAKGCDSRDGQDAASGRELMLAFQAGDSGVFDNIVYRYQQPVQNFLRRYLRDRDRMEDLTQEVFIRVYKSRERYQPTAKFRTWLFTIATRLALNEIRSIRRKRRVFSEIADEPEADSPSPFRRAEDYREETPGELSEEKELRTIINQLIEELPPNQKAAILLNQLQKLSYKEIAEILDVSVMTVKSLLVRGREFLRNRLKPYFEGKPVQSGSPEAGHTEN